MRYYISDCHFYHDKLNEQMDCRGFPDAQSLNHYMIEQWNSRVRRKDEVVILGDFSIANARQTNEIINQLNGTLYLITGNHDHYIHDSEFQKERFVWIKPYGEMHDNKRKVILSHYPVFCYNGQFRLTRKGSPSTYMLYGHVHNTEDERLVRQFIKITQESTRMTKHSDTPIHVPCNMINVFCMYSNYVPLTLDEWIEVRKKQLAEEFQTNLPKSGYSKIGSECCRFQKGEV